MAGTSPAMTKERFCLKTSNSNRMLEPAKRDLIDEAAARKMAPALGGTEATVPGPLPRGYGGNAKAKAAQHKNLVPALN
jgi:hypothetical protein